MHCRQLLNLKNHSIYDSVTYPGLLGPEGLKFPGLMRLAVSGFMSSGLCGPTEDMDILLLSRLSPGTDKYNIYVRKKKKFVEIICRFYFYSINQLKSFI